MVRGTFHGCIFICGWCFLNYLEASDVENSTQQFNERRNHTYHSLYLRSIRVVCYIRVDTYMLMKCALKCEKRGKKMNKMEKKRKSNALQNDQIANILWKNYDSHIFRMIATSSYIKIRICSIWYVFYDNEIEIRRKKNFRSRKNLWGVSCVLCVHHWSCLMCLLPSYFFSSSSSNDEEKETYDRKCCNFAKRIMNLIYSEFWLLTRLKCVNMYAHHIVSLTL